MNILLRPAKISDISNILMLEGQTQFDKYGQDSLIQMFNLDYYKIIVATLNDKVIGYIVATILFEDADILKIIVDSKFRRRGVGKQLIDNLLSICKKNGVKKLHLEVRMDNSTAINFYEDLGFEYEFSRKNYYGLIDAKIYGMNMAICPKEKVIDSYVDLEVSLGNIDRVRKIYQSYIEKLPENSNSWASLNSALAYGFYFSIPQGYAHSLICFSWMTLA